MLVKRFALGMRVPAANMENGEKGCVKTLLDGFAPKDIEGLTFKGGRYGEMFIIVVMGGRLGRMRRVYRRTLANGGFAVLLAAEWPFIENNRLAALPEPENYGVAGEDGSFSGGNRCFGLKAGLR